MTKAAMLVLVLSVLLLPDVSVATTKYSNYKLYKIQLENDDQRKFISQLENEHSEINNLDIWKLTRNESTILISPSFKNEFVQLLKNRNIKYKVQAEDIQRKIDRQIRNPRSRIMTVRSRTRQKKEPHTYYMRYQEMINFLEAKMKSHCTTTRKLQCKIVNIGKTYLKNDMKVLQISYNSNVQNNKSIIWLDGGIHAREWIAPATTVYLADQIMSSSDNAMKMLENYDFYILILFNVDGYEYTHTTTRLWRKNLQPNIGSTCCGTDLNRNFDNEKFGVVNFATSNNPCSQNYFGHKAFSAMETVNVRESVNKIKNRIKLYITFHAYGQFIMHPYGYKRGKYADNVKQQVEAAMYGALAIQEQSGRTYIIGAAPDVLYEAPGGSDDYASEFQKIPYVYTFELSDEGEYGFLLPPWQIKSVGNDMYYAIKAMSDYIYNN